MASTKKAVTKQIYDTIKAELKTPADDAAAMKKFGYGHSVIRSIRNTHNYQEYLERVFRFHGHPNTRQKGRTAPSQESSNPKPKILIYSAARPAEYRREDPRPVIALAAVALISLTALVLGAFSIANFVGGCQP